jgi:hypothetical protein
MQELKKRQEEVERREADLKALEEQMEGKCRAQGPTLSDLLRTS